MFNFGYINETLTIRFIAANADTTINDIDIFFKNFSETAMSVRKQIDKNNAKRLNNNTGMAPNAG